MSTATGLTQEQVDAALAKNATWPYPGTDDGWWLAHDALRLDMAGAWLCAALTPLPSRRR